MSSAGAARFGAVRFARAGKSTFDPDASGAGDDVGDFTSKRLMGLFCGISCVMKFSTFPPHVVITCWQLVQGGVIASNACEWLHVPSLGSFLNITAMPYTSSLGTRFLIR